MDPLHDYPASPVRAIRPGYDRARRRVADWVVRRPNSVVTVVILALLWMAVAALLLWCQDGQRLAVGQVMLETRAARVPFDLVDQTATESDRQLARSRTPRVYVADEKGFADLRTSLKNLPKAVAEVEKIDDVTPALREQFQLTPEALGALRALAADEAQNARFAQRIDELESILRARPLVDPQAFQVQHLAQSQFVELRSGLDGAPDAVTRPTSTMASIKGQGAVRTLAGAAEEAGFAEPLLGVVVARLAAIGTPTYRFDDAATQIRQEELARLTPDRLLRFAPGQILFQRGETLTAEKLAWFNAERQAYRAGLTVWQRAMVRGGAFALALLATIGFWSIAVTFSPAQARRPRRLGALAALFALALLLSAVVARVDPRVAMPMAAIAAVFTTTLVAIGDDRRTAMGFGALLTLIAGAALDLPLESVCVILTGVCVMAWRLREVRTRSSLVGSAAWAGLAVAGGELLLGGLTRPLVAPALEQLAIESATAGIGVALVGFVVLGLLPIIERLLGITTGLTLIELRDPSTPLLRELQQRAPGTYNHSCNVAVLAEAAASAIGADGLLAYVGALYHDIGKMSKPEYFVENQAGGINRHDRLTPAMSLLVIVGHVRDGVELALAHRLPRTLVHFIEAHHGTTLVEYFFHRAKRAAEAAGAPGGAGGAGGPRPMPQEIEYRYPGPRPRTKEVAIVMVCDAAESAVRTLPDPSSAKIDAVVRAIAQKRLMDGQFDECDLTLHELSRIVDAVARTLSSFHHHRVAYPDGAPRAPGARASTGATPAPQAVGAPLTPPTGVPLTGPITQPVVGSGG